MPEQSAGIVSVSGETTLTIGDVTYTGTNYQTVKSAVASETVIAVAADTYDGEGQIDFSGGTIVGEEGAIISGNTVLGGSANGAAMALNGGTNSLSGLTFSSNAFYNTTNKGGGGAVFITNSTAVIRDSVFSGNSSSNYGGAVWAANEVKLTIVNTLFSGNTARVGGALLANPAEVTVSGSTFAGNLGTGGAIYFNSSTLKIDDGTFFDGNTGCAIYFNTGTVTIDGATFSNNESTYGSAIQIVSSAVGHHSIRNVEFYDNRETTSSKGTLYFQGSSTADPSTRSLTIGNLLFDGNSAAILGRWDITIDGLITLKTVTDTISTTAALIVDTEAFLGESGDVAKVVDAQFASEWLKGGSFTVDLAGFTTFRAANDLYVAREDTPVVMVGGIVTDVFPVGDSGYILAGGTYYFGTVYATLRDAATAETQVMLSDGVYTEGRIAVSGRTVAGVGGAIISGNAVSDGTTNGAALALTGGTNSLSGL
ncbi:MAG: hypothetical protein MR051_08515, partial [Lentisphaeria bacterium]|nr:hypothetical protein [Lentisphaeria bacterium]